jgi:hypothetical protein
MVEGHVPKGVRVQVPPSALVNSEFSAHFLSGELFYHFYGYIFGIGVPISSTLWTTDSRDFLTTRLTPAAKSSTFTSTHTPAARGSPPDYLLTKYKFSPDNLSDFGYLAISYSNGEV